ncbi:MAG: F0F1 ATP synthase subunit B [Eubacterium sp.]
MLKFDWNILFTLINLVIFYFLIRRFLFKPILNAMDKRREMIDKQFKEADEAKSQAQELKNEYEAQLDGVENEKKQIISDARKNAKQEYNKILDKAQADADKLKADAKRSSDLACEKAKLAVKEEIASLAMEAAQKVVESSTSPQTDSDLYDEFLNESSDNND